MKVKHTIRDNKGGSIEVEISRPQAIKVMCTECLGFGEENPRNCTDKLCPLWPWRGKSLVAWGPRKPKDAVEDPEEADDDE